MHALAHLPVQTRIRNGSPVRIRPLMPSDREGLRHAAGQLSTDSFYARFHSMPFTLSEAQLDYFTRVDQQRHVALAAFDLAGDAETGIATGRYIQIGDLPAAAELALTVVDAYQRLGVGSLLLEQLIRIAATNGIGTFVMHIHASRRGLLRTLFAAGANVAQVEAGVAEIHLPLHAVAVKGS
ncbi:MAG: GNAT family N-acetyltransferase [Rhodothermales bacterium]